MSGRVAVVGGGILGLAVARQVGLARPGTEVVVFEKEPDVGLHQTGRNSGVVHAGLYYPPGSLKATLCRRGVGLLRAYCARTGVAYQECGKLVVAVDEDELPRLRDIERRATANGVPGLRMLGAAELRAVEPYARGVAALHSPTSAIVDFPAVTRALRKEVEEAGGRVRTGTRVVGICERGGGVRVTVTGPAPAGRGGRAEPAEPFDRLVACAGLYADQVAGLTGDDPSPRIVPFRGDYWMLRPQRRQLVRGLIYPVPDPRYPFLGIHLTRRIDGEVLVGPNALLAAAKEGYTFGTVDRGELWRTLSWPGFWRLARRHWPTGVRELAHSVSRWAFVREARRYVPGLRPADMVRGGAGVRAQAVGRDGSLVDDFVVHHQGRVVHVRNAPSPAATSSLAIAESVVAEL
ncbi:MAG TPA: L-2-hydroxyglutarate oxidase [Frankiaceae bacterium]|nr:L-2-hydroxyglutarate oxidase [Frankiaceae bacterium]